MATVTTTKGATWNFEIHQGATFDTELAITDSNGDPVNLTGHSARFTAKPASGSLIEWTDTNGKLVVNGAAGTIVFAVSATATAALDFRTIPHDIETEDGSGEVERWLEGSVTLNKQVS